MIEDDIRALTQEIRLLRKAIESQSLIPTVPSSPARDPRPSPPAALPSPPKPDIINEHDVAKMLCLSVATVRRWRLAREGPPYRKLGAAVRYSRSQIQQWMDTQPGLRLEETGELKPCRG